MIYTALVMDICSSKEMPVDKRNTAQHFIQGCLKPLNSIFSHQLVKSVEFSAGDSVQGLFSSADAAFLYARLFLMLLYPVPFRCGFGVGAWSIEVNDSTNAQDGPVYHLAKEAVDIAHEDDSRVMVIKSYLSGDYDLNALLLGVNLLKRKQTARQNQYQLLLEMASPLLPGPGLDGSFKEVYELLKSKERKHFVTSFLPSGKLGFEPDCLDTNILQSNFLPNIIDTAVSDPPNYISARKKGLVMTLSSATGATRQNVEDALNKGEAYHIRDIDISITMSLAKRYGGMRE